MPPVLKTGDRNKSPANITRVRRMRSEPTASETHMWALLRGNRLGVKFRRQHPVGPYVLDFYCPEAALCVEVDGEIHAEHKLRDERRDRYLAERGILTMGVPSLALFAESPAELNEAITEITRLCEERKAPSPRDTAEKGAKRENQ